MKWNNPLPLILSASKHPTRNVAGWIKTTRILLILCLLPPALVMALESDKQQPIYMEADGVEINDGTGISTYQGNVVVTQGSIRITADKVTVTRKPNGADYIVAHGNPTTFQQTMEGKNKKIEGHSKQAEYDTNSEVIIMIGDAVLIQGKDSFKSDRIVYDRVRERVRAGATAKGTKRVRITIQPKTKAAQDKK